MTEHTSQQPRKEQESYQPLWDDSLPVPSYMNISLGNGEAPAEASPQQASENTASPAAASTPEREPGVYSYTSTLKVTPTPIFGTPDPSLQRMHIQDIPGTRPAPESAMEGPGAATNQRLPEGTVGYIREVDALYPDGAPTTWEITRGAWLFFAIVVFCNPLIDALIIYPFDNQAAVSLSFLGVILAMSTAGIPVILWFVFLIMAISKVYKKYSEAREQRWNAEEAPAFWYYPVYIG